MLPFFAVKNGFFTAKKSSLFLAGFLPVKNRKKTVNFPLHFSCFNQLIFPVLFSDQQKTVSY